MAPGLRPSSKRKSSITKLSGLLGGTTCFETSPFKAELPSASATDRFDIAKTSISSPATKFDSLPLDDFSKTLRSDLLKSYDTEVSVREPKVVNDFDGVGSGDGRCPLIPTSRAPICRNSGSSWRSRPFRRIRPRFAGSRSTIPNLMECMTTSRSGARRSRRFWPTSSSHSPPPIRISGIATSGISPGSSVRRRSTSLP